MIQFVRFVLPLALTATLAGGALVAPSMANSGADGAHSGGHHQDWKAKKAEMRKRFAEELNLTAEQQTKIDALHQNFRESHKAEFEAMRAKHKELRALKQSGKATPEEIKAKKQAMKQEFSGLKKDRQELMTRVKAVLTPEQVQKMEAMKAQHKEKHQKRRQAQ